MGWKIPTKLHRKRYVAFFPLPVFRHHGLEDPRKTSPPAFRRFLASAGVSSPPLVVHPRRCHLSQSPRIFVHLYRV
jgi:hypothetical protein